MSNLSSVFFYLLTYVISAILLSRSKAFKEKRIDMFFILALLIPVLLAAYRYYVGTDYENYLYMCRRMSRYRFSTWFSREFSLEGVPFGIWLFSRVARRFRTETVFFGLLACVIYFPWAYVLKKRFPQEITFCAAFLFLTSLFTTGLNIIKQVAAVGIVFWGLEFVYQRKLWKYCLAVILACCFHPSAFIALPIYFFWKSEDVKISFKRIVLFGACLIFLSYVSQFFSMLGERFESYTLYTDEISNKSFFLTLAWAVYFFIMRKRYEEADYRNDLLITMVLVGAILGASGFTSPFIKRISMYYTFPQYILIAQVPFLYHENDKFITKSMVFVYTIVMFIVNFYFYEFSDIIPYAFIGGA